VNDEKLKQFEDLIANEMRNTVVDYLKNNPQIIASSLAVGMVSKGMVVSCASNLTGVPVEEINKLQNTIH
jgi:hypothetical protein